MTDQQVGVGMDELEMEVDVYDKQVSGSHHFLSHYLLKVLLILECTYVQIAQWSMFTYTQYTYME